MRSVSRLTFAAILFAVATAPAADEPAPLLKPVTPPGSGVRVRVPFSTENMFTDSQMKAQVPKAKAKKGEKAEMVDVTVAFDTLPGKSVVSAKKWQSWGYEVPPNRIGILPELVIAGSQLAPKTSKGRDVQAKFTGIALEIIEPPANSDVVYGSDIYIRINDLARGGERGFEPRFYFGDKFFEFTVPGNTIKRLGTGNETPPDPAVSTDEKLVPASGPMMMRAAPVFAFASINGLSQYKTPDGKPMTVNVGVSSNTNWPGGIMMTIGTARGCGVEIDDDKDLKGTGTTFETTIAKGKVKEFRLAFQTSPGVKGQKDLVLKDVTVYVDKNNSEHFVWLGSKFMKEHVTDAVYTLGSDGWRLHGRLKPDLLQDIKTRTVPKKP